MFIELIDLLRCTTDHEDSWLVAAFTKMDQRFVIEGRLGCPVCGASFPILDGVVDMRGTQAEPGNVSSMESVDSEGDDPVRLAALLDLTRPGALVVLEHGSARAASSLGEIAEARVIALNPEPVIEETDRVAVVLSSGRIPLAANAVDGIVVTRSAASLGDAARVLKSGGRLIAPSSIELGGNFRELARDDRQLVAESIGQLVPLSR